MTTGGLSPEEALLEADLKLIAWGWARRGGKGRMSEYALMLRMELVVMRKGCYRSNVR